MVDRFTRWPEAVPLVDMSANTVARAFISTWIARFGVPSNITTDRGRQFESLLSLLWTQLMRLLGTTRIRTTAYHPCANGLVERFHRQLKASLRTHITPNWTDSLPMVLLGIRTSLKSDIGTSSAELVYGTTLRIPGEFFNTSLDSSVVDPSNFVVQLKDVLQKLRAVSPCTQQRKTFIHDDLATASHVFKQHNAVRSSLQPPYDGPFKVLERRDKYFVIDIKGRKETVSLDRLKPAYMEAIINEDNSFSPTCIQPTPPTPPTPITKSRSGRVVRFPNKLNL